MTLPAVIARISEPFGRILETIEQVLIADARRGLILRTAGDPADGDERA